MTPNLQPYPAYKASGIEWLGQVPAHWDLMQLGCIGRLSKGIGGTKEDEVPEGIPCIRYGDLYTSHKYHIQATRSFVSETKAADYTPIKYGDILFAGSGETIEEIGKSAVNLVDSPACCGGDVILFRPDIEMDARFSGYAIDCPPSQYQKSCMGRGITIMHIYGDELKGLRITLPPPPEQTAIVRFLDHVDRRIRRYLHAKEKLIELLEEQKQAIIQQAVTGQIDVRTGQPYPSYKDSGAEWMGDVPKHWEVVRNGQLFVQRNEKGFPELPILEVSLKTGVRIRDMENPDRKQVMAARGEYKRAVKGDIAYNMMRMWQGAVGVAPVDGLVSPAYVVANPRRGTEPRYFSSLFRTSAYMVEVDKCSRGIVKDRNRLYWEDFKQMPTPYPPADEQVRIANAIEQSMATIDNRMRRIHCQIELVQEYRSCLIADVVTGKLDVRGAAAALPVVDPLAEEDVDDTIHAEADSNLEEHAAVKEVIL